MRFHSHGCWIPAISVVAALLTASSPEFAEAQTRAEASPVMAAFVSRFPQFVEWPVAALEGRSALTICVAQPDPFGGVLDELTANQEINGRTLEIRRIDRPAAVPECHILYVPPTARAEAFVSVAAGLPILTIGESGDFLEDGGVLRLVIVDRRVRFEVNAAAAGRAGLRLSSQLLGLALQVRGIP
jgi:hypothetical protein